jgi:hypothetical protein
MKKLIGLVLIALVATMAFTMQSCDPEKNASKESNAMPLLYDLTATATGQVEFNWLNGGATIDGNATIYQCNDTTKKIATLASTDNNGILLQDALESDADSIKNAAETVQGLLKVKGIAGNYHLTLKGYVKYGPIYLVIDEEYPKDSIQ